MTNGVEELIRKWQRILGIHQWTIRLRDEPPPEPSRNAAFSEYEYPTKTCVMWAQSPGDVIHESLHLLLAGLDDVFWQAERTKALDALWRRREEEVVKRLERALSKLSRKQP